ncbi:hypothetical protein FRC18_006991 [Serendipita sp. 400]|nr:hypothetical protein FRC18_006991 [Serendipita sp. 400]
MLSTDRQVDISPLLLDPSLPQIHLISIFSKKYSKCSDFSEASLVCLVRYNGDVISMTIHRGKSLHETSREITCNDFCTTRRIVSMRCAAETLSSESKPATLRTTQGDTNAFLGDTVLLCMGSLGRVAIEADPANLL